MLGIVWADLPIASRVLRFWKCWKGENRRNDESCEGKVKIKRWEEFEIVINSPQARTWKRSTY